jgi:hypothetical protein
MDMDTDMDMDMEMDMDMDRTVFLAACQKKWLLLNFVIMFSSKPIVKFINLPAIGMPLEY